MSLLGDLAAAAIPPLAELLYKLATGQIVTKDDAIQGVANVAIAAGISDGLVAHLTAADAKSTKEMEAAARAAMYPGEP